jgi:hypothetical protein
VYNDKEVGETEREREKNMGWVGEIMLFVGIKKSPVIL